MTVRRRTIHDLLEEARARLVRLQPVEAMRASHAGALLVDTRSPDERRAGGLIPGAVAMPLSELEWRLDPDSGHNDDPTIGLDRWIVLVCAEGYASSLAAARLQSLGFARATDLVGGFDAWKAAGLPVLPAPS